MTAAAEPQEDDSRSRPLSCQGTEFRQMSVLVRVGAPATELRQMSVHVCVGAPVEKAFGRKQAGRVVLSDAPGKEVCGI